ncbi:MAG: hypothetical protein SFU85_05575 [Candidatus Methylacidiphilales bacterium]|nr:hypothetical protein [Candidatus Methylacidiphilales bacterium]
MVPAFTPTAEPTPAAGARALSAPVLHALLFTSVLLLSISAAPAQFASTSQTVVWPVLDRHQHTLTRAAFEERLPLYSPDGSIHDYLVMDPDGVTVHETPEKTRPLWTLKWAQPGDRRRDHAPAFRFARTTLAEWTGASAEKPLAGLTIGLDPGHIGGAWADIEERNLKIRGNPPIKEGDMALIVAQHLAPLLEEAGARIAWIRDSLEPVTPLRPADLVEEAMQSMATLDDRTLARLTQAKFLRTHELRTNLLFYRPAEIGARAERVRALKPDLTLCLHYNAAPWGRFSRPRLFNANKLVIFVHGAYTKGELADEAQRFHLFRKLLEGSADEELSVANDIAVALARGWGFPPENYDSWNVATKAGDNPYVWARNLLANRLFDGPVVFVEGPYMNDRAMFKRMLAGDYEGEKDFDGKMQRSIHREYAEYVAQGVIAHYQRSFVGPGQESSAATSSSEAPGPPPATSGEMPTDPGPDLPHEIPNALDPVPELELPVAEPAHTGL